MKKEEKQNLANRPNLEELKRILDDELSEETTKIIDGYLLLRSWIYDAMEEYAKFRNIKIIEERLKNQLRIHWKWLKDQPYEELVKFVMNIVDGQLDDQSEQNVSPIETINI